MINAGEKLNRLHELITEKETLDNILAGVKGEIEGIKNDLAKLAEALGVDKFANDLMTVSIKEDMRAGYTPEEWPAIFAWIAKTENFGIIQRRLSAKPIQELIDCGTPLPKGLKLEPYTKVSTRRNS